MRRAFIVSAILAACLARTPAAPPTDAEALAANVAAVAQALEQLKASLPVDAKELKAAIAKADAGRLQELLDLHALLTVSINPEARVKVARGRGPAELRQNKEVPVLVK